MKNPIKFEQIIFGTDAVYGENASWHERILVCTECGTLVHKDYTAKHGEICHLWNED